MSWSPPPGYPGPMPYGVPPGPAPGLLYASFGRRLGGYLLDGLVIGIPVGVLLAVLVADYFDPNSSRRIHLPVGSAAITDLLPGQLLIGVSVGMAAAYLLYFGVLVSLWGRTVGQTAVGVRVVRQEDPSRRLPASRALLRASIWWLPPLLIFVPVLGNSIGVLTLIALLWAAWDPQKQGLHDKLGHALVVRPLPAWAAVPPGYPAAPFYPAPQGYPTRPGGYPTSHPGLGPGFGEYGGNPAPQPGGGALAPGETPPWQPPGWGT